jgi:polyhydroxyalkanoate synthesis regulator phasin
MTEKAARGLIDDLVAKGDITRKEGERMFTHLEREWGEESGRFARAGSMGPKGLEQVILGALSTALDRAGLARKSEVDALRREVEGRAAKKGRAAGASKRGARSGRARKTRSGGPGPT